MYLGVSCLGMMPVVGREGTRALRRPWSAGTPPPTSAKPSAGSGPTSWFVVRAVSVKTLAVTSASPEEGKTAVASNLALVLTQAGPHVLLIDADMRRPRIHEVFGVPQQPGLSSVLRQPQEARGDLIRRDKVSGLDILTAGSEPPNPAELLATRVFGDLVRRLSADYDHIIIDCAPVMAVTDASEVASDVSGVLFVVGAQVTTRAAARAALDELRQTRDNVVGAVLNGVDFRHNRYYYARYYRPDYDRYYRRA